MSCVISEIMNDRRHVMRAHVEKGSRRREGASAARKTSWAVYLCLSDVTVERLQKANITRQRWD